MEKFSIPSDEMEKIPSNKIPENKPESVGEAVSNGIFGFSIFGGIVLFGILLCFTGIGIILGIPMILGGLLGIVVSGQNTVEESIELIKDK